MYINLGKIESTDLRPIREIVLESLREAIFDGRLKEGDRLVETNIAEIMGVSRTPVREALRQLELEGLAVNIPRRGTVVKGISMEDAVEIYDMREVLEGLAVRLACLNISRGQLLCLKQVVNDMEECIQHDDRNQYNKLHNEFNMIIIQASNNKRLVENMEHIYEYLTNLRNVSLENFQGRKEALKEHREVLDALEKGDENLAESLTRQHVKNAKNRFVKNKGCV